MTSNDYIDILRRIEAGFDYSILPLNASIKTVLTGTSDEFYLWLLGEGATQVKNPALRAMLPVMPDETTQATFTGRSGRDTLNQAFAAFKLFKKIASDNGLNLSDNDMVLDFGCGWGRLTRFFLKDVEPDRIFGVDVKPEIIDLCNRSGLRANFETIAPFPPIRFDDNTFDLIYLFSVFSHLSESACSMWMAEFHRILRPGGIVIATTRPRSFLMRISAMREAGAAPIPLDTDEALADYDSGHFCHVPTGGGSSLEKSFYGETAIPRQYVEERWTRLFPKVDFIFEKEHMAFDQNVIVARKGLANERSLYSAFMDAIELGEMMVSDGRQDEARSLFESLLASIEDVRGSVLNNIADISIKRGRLDTAELVLMEAARIGHEVAIKRLEALRDSLVDPFSSGDING